MHQEVKDFIIKTKQKYPQYFKNKRVLELGSLNINGSPRDFFENCEYIGIDRMSGKDVDIVCEAYKFKDNNFDIVITTEMLEHDKYAKDSIFNGFNLLNNGGIFIGTAANINREPHFEFTGEDNHYQNISKKMINNWAKELNCKYEIEEDNEKNDIRFILFK